MLSLAEDKIEDNKQCKYGPRRDTNTLQIRNYIRDSGRVVQPFSPGTLPRMPAWVKRVMAVETVQLLLQPGIGGYPIFYVLTCFCEIFWAFFLRALATYIFLINEIQSLILRLANNLC